MSDNGKQPNILERIRCGLLVLLLLFFFCFGAIMLAQSIVHEGHWLEYLCWTVWTLAGGFLAQGLGASRASSGGQDIA